MLKASRDITLPLRRQEKAEHALNNASLKAQCDCESKHEILRTESGLGEGRDNHFEVQVSSLW